MPDAGLSESLSYVSLSAAPAAMLPNVANILFGARRWKFCVQALNPLRHSTPCAGSSLN